MPDSKHFKFNEDFTDSSAVDVHYMSPEELKSNEKISTEFPNRDDREVFHDNEEEEKNSQGFPFFGSKNFTKPEDDIIDLPHVNDYTPIDAINHIKADPANVMVARYNDNNYVAYGDVKNYMDASNTRDYDTAVGNIIDSNDDESLHNNGLKIVMTKSEFDECTDKEKANLEAANVELEIYK